METSSHPIVFHYLSYNGKKKYKQFLKNEWGLEPDVDRRVAQASSPGPELCSEHDHAWTDTHQAQRGVHLTFIYSHRSNINYIALEWSKLTLTLKIYPFNPILAWSYSVKELCRWTWTINICYIFIYNGMKRGTVESWAISPFSSMSVPVFTWWNCGKI